MQRRRRCWTNDRFAALVRKVRRRPDWFLVTPERFAASPQAESGIQPLNACRQNGFRISPLCGVRNDEQTISGVLRRRSPRVGAGPRTGCQATRTACTARSYSSEILLPSSSMVVNFASGIIGAGPASWIQWRIRVFRSLKIKPSLHLSRKKVSQLASRFSSALHFLHEGTRFEM